MTKFYTRSKGKPMSNLHIFGSLAAAGGGAGGSPATEFDVTVPSGAVGSDLPNFAFPIDLSGAPISFWSQVNVGGTNIRVFDSDGTTPVPCHVQNIHRPSQSGVIWVAKTITSAANTVVKIKLTSDKFLPSLDSVIGSRSVFGPAQYEVAVLGGPKVMNLGLGAGPAGGGTYWQALATLGVSPDTNIHEDFIYDETGDRWWGVHSASLYYTTDPFGGSYSAINHSTTLLSEITSLLSDGTTYTDFNGGFYNPGDDLLYVGFYGAGGVVNGIARVHPTTLALVGAVVTSSAASTPFQGADYCLFDVDKIAAFEYSPSGASRLWIAELAPPHNLVQTITTDTPIFSAQGIFWWPKEQCFVVSGATRALYRVDPDFTAETGEVSLINYNPSLATHEGVGGTSEDWITQLNVEDKVYKHDTQNAYGVGGSAAGSFYLGAAHMAFSLSPAVGNTFWAYVRAVQESTDNKYHMSLQQSGGSRVSLYHNSGAPRLETSFGMSPIVSAGGVANGVPNSWCFRYDAGSVEFWKDGVSAGVGVDAPTNLTTFVCGKANIASSVPPNSHYSCVLLSRQAKSDDWLSALELAIANNANFCSITEA